MHTLTLKKQMKISSRDIIELYALCKVGNFSFHIWAWFGYFITNKGNQVLFIIWRRINKLFGPRKRACIS